ncbi:DUF4339 domain-containing protein [Colwellia sp. E2M01]|uniref:DUF4339 domain-containing protein n=1 Tax=Colwellia sp. E2M01 TaxID=2841561 RepID=UPI001C094A94|nr:DUF4339 domain-containing protein [Colwellia sp. E2M01]MBU2870438.1 hypothetical protein [Colwellia sp. E2M01]
MKRWFFSNNGKVIGALDLAEAKDYLADNPNVYGWHPSFTQWKPVCCISEFVDVLPPTVQSPLIPKEISDKFLAKQQRLETKLTSIDDSINHSQKSLDKFDNQIMDYKELTQNLNDDVKGAIDNIERKYNSIRRKLSQVREAVTIAEKEMSVAVSDFDTRMSTNDIFMPSCNQSAVTSDNTNTAAKASKAKLAQEKLATPHKRVEAVAEKPVEQKESPNQSKSSTEEAAKESFGMKNMMKSVFKGDSKVEKTQEVKDVKKGKEEPLSMAERLKMAQNNH